MKQHFSLESWADFANQKLAPAVRTSMERHLETGCSNCARVVAKWRSLKHFALQESHNEPPRDAVAHVKAAFRTLAPRPAPGVVEIFAGLILDSFLQPMPAGTRSGQPNSRYLVFQAGPIVIDLNLDLAQDSRQIALQGQVMDSETKARGMDELPVRLLSGQETSGRPETNEFGEFQMTCDARKNIQISVGVSPQKNVFIVLDEGMWASN